jgi:hypothetical protein
MSLRLTSAHHMRRYSLWGSEELTLEETPGNRDKTLSFLDPQVTLNFRVSEG